MADVLLTHSYHLYYDRKQVRKMQPYPPLGTLYAAALLRSAGISVALFDTMLSDPETGFESALKQHCPKIVAVFEDNFNFLSKMCLTRMREVAYHILETSRCSGATVLVNGSDASDHTLDYLKKGFRCVLLGEAECTLLEAVTHVLRGDEEGLNIVASRGCPYRCNWCAKPIYGDSFSVRSPALVAEEMRQLKHDFGVDHLWFADDIFGLRPKWVRQLADEVERLDAAIPFKMQSRVDLMTPDTVRALRRAGCAEVWMGAESGSQKILDAMDKGTRVDQIAKARENLRREGIRACYFLQFGYPGETWNDIQNTIRLVRDTRPDDIGVSVSYPLPGTKFFDRVQAQLGEKTNWSDSEDLAMMFQGTYTNELYRALHDALHAQVDYWNSCSTEHGAEKRLAQREPDGLWRRVMELEKTCRNPRPTVFTSSSRENLVQLQAHSYATSFDELLSVLAS
jgi:radical SAM superfamily enzyme YgiQ (UPF0313 family)